MTHDEIEQKLKAALEAVQSDDYKELERLVDDVSNADLTDLQRIEAIRIRGLLEEHRDNYTQALNLHMEALSIAEAVHDKSLIARLTNNVGIAHHNLGDHAQALEHYNRALRLREELGDRLNAAKIHTNIGGIYSFYGDYPKAMQHFGIALAEFETCGDRASIATTVNNIGILHVEQAHYKDALECYNRALDINQELGRKSGLANQLTNIGNVYQCLADYSKALDSYAKALEIHEDLAELSRVASVNMNMGIVFSEISDYTSSLKYFSRALAISDELGDQHAIAVTKCNLASVHKILGNITLALEYYHNSASFFDQCGDKRSLSRVLGQIGTAYQSIEDSTKALEYLHRSLDLHIHLGQKFDEAIAANNLGNLYVMLSDYTKAMEYYNRALEIDKGLGAKSGVASTTLNLGELFTMKEFAGYSVESAKEFILSALSLYEEIGEKQGQSQCHEALAELHANDKNWEQAYQHFATFHVMEKEIMSEETTRTANKIEVERNEAEREKQRTIAKAEMESRMHERESLLKRVFPESIAQRLMNGERIADYFPHLSILFADIVGFTPISSQMPAHVVVKFLNHVFGVFDSIMKEHGCEKIKTIGDGYIAVAGAPVECADHAERIAAAALAMQRDILLPDDIREHIEEGTVFNIRIGIHVGSAVGGIIGDERFVFDVYSDAVNFAARMEQSSEPGKIHVSTDFAMHLQNRINQIGGSSPFKLVRRGQIEIKGKGAVKTYWLEQA